MIKIIVGDLFQAVEVYQKLQALEDLSSGACDVPLFYFFCVWVFFFYVPLKYMFLERELGGRQAKQVKGIKNHKFPSIR